jgi:hypothetical protein
LINRPAGFPSNILTASAQAATLIYDANVAQAAEKTFGA